MYSAYAEFASDYLTGRQNVPIVRCTYSRRMNDVGRCEIETMIGLVDLYVPYVGRAFIALHYRGRIEDIYTIMDYERSRFGTVRIYGENAAAMLRDAVREVPTDSTSATLSGDLSVMMGQAMIIPPSQSPLADTYLWRVNAMRAGFIGTVQVSWGSPMSAANAVSAAAATILAMRYPFGWYVRGHHFAGKVPYASIFIVIPRFVGLRPDIAYAETARMEWSSAYTSAFGLGKGIGSDRDVEWASSPLRHAAIHAQMRRVASMSQPADTAAAAQRIALYQGAGRVSGTITLAPNLRYWDYFELGDIVSVATSSHLTRSDTRAISGSVREIRGEIIDGVVKHTIDLWQ